MKHSVSTTHYIEPLPGSHTNFYQSARRGEDSRFSLGGMRSSRQGFTIVELLIVIVIIAILAAITIVAYNGVQNRANDSAVKSDLSNIAKKLELIKVAQGRYPRSATSDFGTDFKFSKSSYSRTGSNALYCLNHDTDQYALGVTSKSGMRYLLTQAGVTENVDVRSNAVCGAVGTAWSSPPVPRTAIHGYAEAGSSPSYIDGWNGSWVWTN